MSAGTDASQIGYGKIAPLSNINGKFVNVDNSNSPSRFGSNEIPGLPGLSGAKNNVVAAMGKVPGICLFKGGSKGLKRKIKNITKHYKKMKAGSRKMKSLKLKLRRRMASRSLARRFVGGRRTRSRQINRRRRRTQRGGYSQYQNNQPFSLSYSVGGVLPANQLALANPPPIASVTNNAVDNYNHYTNTGFPSKGH